MNYNFQNSQRKQLIANGNHCKMNVDSKCTRTQNMLKQKNLQHRHKNSQYEITFLKAHSSYNIYIYSSYNDRKAKPALWKKYKPVSFFLIVGVMQYNLTGT